MHFFIDKHDSIDVKLTSINHFLLFFSCLLWVKYGVLIEDNNVIFVNLLGSIIEGIYTGIFCLYAKEKVTMSINIQLSHC